MHHSICSDDSPSKFPHVYTHIKIAHMHVDASNNPRTCGAAGEGVPNKNFTHAWLAKNGATDAFAAKYASFSAELEGMPVSEAEEPSAEKAAEAFTRPRSKTV